MSRFAAAKVHQRASVSPAEIIDEVRRNADSIGTEVDSISRILEGKIDQLRDDVQLRLATRQLACQQYASAREDRQRLLGMLQQAEARLFAETKVFTAIEDLTRS